MKYVIFDCDCTYGVKGCDVDDGMALMYLLADPDTKLLGVTTTYGNSREEIVYEALMRLLKHLGRTDIPVIRGGNAEGVYNSAASEFIASMSREYEGRLSLLGTGSTTNIGGAYFRDPMVFPRLREMVFMGGITEPLVFAKRIMDELNFSCDPKATEAMLTHGNNVSVITGNNCLKVLFTKEDYERRFDGTLPIVKFIRSTTDYWFDDNDDTYGIKGFYNWDITAAAYLLHPELFDDVKVRCRITEETLKTGFLNPVTEGETCSLNLPCVQDEELFKQNLFECLSRLSVTREALEELKE
ncbi:MAG: nucleoside hydrolase [Eubacteriales bacterium]|nr:nucleoside hydrolase [Eubacteriales bacterium]